MSTRAERVCTQLRDSIIRGDHVAGSRLNEVDLAAEFGVSRTPIRAALSELASEGLLDYMPNAGYSVRTYSAQQMLGIFEARAALEGLATRQAVENGITEAQRALMQRAIDETEAVLSRRRWEADVTVFWSHINTWFHGAILEAAHNDHLAWLLRKSRSIPLVYSSMFRRFDLNRIAKAHEEHVTILEAITQRQAVRAESLAREHIYKAGLFVVERMREHEMQAAHAAAMARADGSAPPQPVAP